MRPLLFRVQMCDDGEGAGHGASMTSRAGIHGVSGPPCAHSYFKSLLWIRAKLYCFYEDEVEGEKDDFHSYFKPIAKDICNSVIIIILFYSLL